MNNLNIIHLVGRIGAKPETRFFESGATVAKMSLAVSRNSADKTPDWFAIEAWEKLAEVATNYVDKGSLIGVTGELIFDNWQDANTGEQRSKAIIRAKSIELLSSADKKESENF
jgi:single-strand DNA-binding protein